MLLESLNDMGTSAWRYVGVDTEIAKFAVDSRALTNLLQSPQGTKAILIVGAASLAVFAVKKFLDKTVEAFLEPFFGRWLAWVKKWSTRVARKLHLAAKPAVAPAV